MTLVSTRLAKSAQLHQASKTICFTGAQGTPLKQASTVAELQITPVHSSTTQLYTVAAIVKEVTCNLPVQGVAHIRDLPHLQSLVLANPTFDRPGRIDVLIGCDLFSDILTNKQVVGPVGTPKAVHTIFGWAIVGQYPSKSSNQVVNVTINQVLDPLNELLTRFWKVEEPPDNPSLFTPTEQSSTATL